MNLSSLSRFLPQRAKLLKLIRRIHMYAGLLLFPWILLFGLSGIFFNHPNLGEKTHGQFLPQPVLQELTQITPWDPAVVSAELVERLNAQSGEPLYRLDGQFPARFQGYAVFGAESPEGQHNFIFEPKRGVAILAERKARPSGDVAPFEHERIPLETYSVSSLEERLDGLLAKKGLASKNELTAHPKIHPRLEYRMLDRSGSSWNVSYDLKSGELSGRRTDQWPNLGLSQLITTLHTTHHFTMGLSARWFWALFEDLLGLTMIFWAISGLIMWWQMRPTRVLGITFLALALGLGFFVMYSTASELFFGAVPQQLGPGD